MHTYTHTDYMYMWGKGLRIWMRQQTKVTKQYEGTNNSRDINDILVTHGFVDLYTHFLLMPEAGVWNSLNTTISNTTFHDRYVILTIWWTKKKRCFKRSNLNEWVYIKLTFIG